MSSRSVVIAPSVLSADITHLSDRIGQVVDAGADWIHVDVMDGHFVPNITFGANMISALTSITNVPLDVHLMVTEPERYIEPFAKAGASVFTFHPEATTHTQRHLSTIREHGMKAGLAINPSTPLSSIVEVVDDLDLLLIMSVNPGFGGQSYIPASTDKIRRARGLLDQRHSGALLEVDGGITIGTIADAFTAGADTFVAGSAIFGTESPAQMVKDLRARCTEGSLV